MSEEESKPRAPSALGGEASSTNDASERRRRRRLATRRGPHGATSAFTKHFGMLPVVVLVAFTIVGSVLAAGTVHVSVLLFIAPFAITAGGWAIGRDGRGVSAIAPPAWIAFALSGYSAFQATPMPSRVLRALSPVTASTWARALSPVGASGSWLSISLDPGASAVEALKWFCYGSMFCAGAAIASHQSRRVVPAIVFGSALVAALVALVNRLSSADSLFGLYTPVLHSSFGVTPLINVNNFAGYLNLGAFAGLGLLMSRRPIAPPWAIGLGVSIVVGTSAVCGSRAGLALLAFGVLALIAAPWFVKLEGPRRSIWIPIGALLGGIALFLMAVNAGLWQSMIQEGTKKLALISWTMPLMMDFPVFGIGRGAFETVFPAYRADLGHHMYQFAENFVMQWCVEWGVPIALAALLGFAYTLRPRHLRGRSDVLAVCCGIGAIVLILQNLLDLALEVASVCFALSALLGNLWSHHRQQWRNTGAFAPLRLRGRPVAFFGVGVLLWSVTAIAGRNPAESDREAIARLTTLHQKGDVAASKALGDELKAAVLRHPADPYFPLVAATVTRRQNGAAMTWISRAIERDPMAGRPYLLLATMLARRNARTQTLQAVRLAVAREYGLIGPAVTVALSVTHDPAELTSAVPEGSAGIGMLVYLARLGELQAFRAQLLKLAIDRDPTALEPRIVRADDLLDALEAKRTPCDEPRRTMCAGELRALLPVIARIDPKSDRSVVFGARLLMLEGNAVAAERLLAGGCKRLLVQTACAQLRFSVAEQLGDRTIIQDATSSLLADVCATQAGCAATASWLAQRFAAQGDPVHALRMYERAAQEAGTPQAWRELADFATHLGLRSVANSAIERANGHGSAPPAELKRTMEETRRDALGELVLDAGAD